jgi:uncharacterized protein
MMVIWRFWPGLGALLCFFMLAAAPHPARADAYPAPADPYLNDFAGLVAPDAAARMRDALKSLRDETGVEMTVLTIASRRDYDPSPSIEAFATGLFNDWGIGDAGRNDGILVLVARADREMRIELGQGYDQGYDVLAQDMINRHFLPWFRDDKYSEGIEEGTLETVTRIARRHAEGLAPESVSADRYGWIVGALVGAIFLAVGGLILFGRHIGNLVYSLRRCPNCGQRGLHRHSTTVTAATRATTGLRDVIVTCDYCNYRDQRQETIPVRGSSSSGGSFGGGSSSGGGASGKW